MFTLDEVVLALEANYPNYEWPPNYYQTIESITAWLYDYPDSQFEVGGEDTMIRLRNMCAWEFTLLDAMAEGDQSTIDDALPRLRTMLASIRTDDPEGIRFIGDIYNKAELGDPAPLQQWAKTNCSEITWDERG
jgi:hypothetical protein